MYGVFFVSRLPGSDFTDRTLIVSNGLYKSPILTDYGTSINNYYEIPFGILSKDKQFSIYSNIMNYGTWVRIDKSDDSDPSRYMGESQKLYYNGGITFKTTEGQIGLHYIDAYKWKPTIYFDGKLDYSSNVTVKKLLYTQMINKWDIVKINFGVGYNLIHEYSFLESTTTLNYDFIYSKATWVSKGYKLDYHLAGEMIFKNIITHIGYYSGVKWYPESIHKLKTNNTLVYSESYLVSGSNIPEVIYFDAKFRIKNIYAMVKIEKPFWEHEIGNTNFREVLNYQVSLSGNINSKIKWQVNHQLDYSSHSFFGVFDDYNQHYLSIGFTSQINEKMNYTFGISSSKLFETARDQTNIFLKFCFVK